VEANRRQRERKKPRLLPHSRGETDEKSAYPLYRTAPDSVKPGNPWVRLHCGFPPHRRGLLDHVLGIRKAEGMAVFDHLGITVTDLPGAIARYDAVLQPLGFTRQDAEGSVSWQRDDEPELILFPARQPGSAPHRHGEVGWQHLAFAVDSRDEVDRLHAVALDAGWYAVRDPMLYPRFSDRYYASFLEDEDGIRIEFMHNPPRDQLAG